MSRMTELADSSGNYKTSNKLVAFLYELMRDHMPPGQIESVLMNSTADTEYKLTNGYLASYAENVASKLV